MILVYKYVYIFGLERHIETTLTPGDSAVNSLSVECWTNRNGWEPRLRLQLLSQWKFVHESLIPRVTSVLHNCSTRNYRRSTGLVEGFQLIPWPWGSVRQACCATRVDFWASGIAKSLTHMHIHWHTQKSTHTHTCTPRPQSQSLTHLNLLVRVHWRTGTAWSWGGRGGAHKVCAKAVSSRSYNVTQHYNNIIMMIMLTLLHWLWCYSQWDLQYSKRTYRGTFNMPSRSKFCCVLRPILDLLGLGDAECSACALNCSACAVQSRYTLCVARTWMAARRTGQLAAVWTWRPIPPRIWIYRRASGEMAIFEWCVF